MLSYLNCINEITEQTIDGPQGGTATAVEGAESNNKISK